MRIYLGQNVYDAALDRIRYLFDEFPNIIVNTSGGKDSTIILNLALQVAEERGCLPLKVMFIDQEAEWQAVINHMREIMSDPRVEPIWLQVPMMLFNATSTIEPWLHCWEDGKEWVRDKEVNSIRINEYGTDRFAKMFEAYNRVHYPNAKVARIAGVRAEESPARRMGLTSYITYKDITWGKKEDVKRGHYTFYPIYDWSYTDVWAAIHKNGWPYCKIYDYMYQYGVPIREMRVSNVHHETAVKILFYLQEIEGETWNRITRRISGINTAGQLREGSLLPSSLPHMFDSWREYRDYLLENLINDEGHRRKIAKSFVSEERRYADTIYEKLMKMQIGVVLVNDYHGTKQSTFVAANSRKLVTGKFGAGQRSIRQMLDERGIA